ncbi:MAG: hypothetical protein IJ493_04360 [Clostridia bacterium]|nr:hypothetical protein [Clostridia bacterium]
MMTELELIARAKLYMDKLSRGENPFDDTPIPYSDITQDERCQRCFGYISDVLRRILETGEIPGAPKVKKVRTEHIPFTLTQEQRERFPYSDSPITLMDIVRRVNGMINTEHMVKLTHRSVSTRLMEIGMLRLHTIPGSSQVKRPTNEGLALGISVERRISQRGPYDVVVYNRAAQQFIIDDLDAIAELNVTRPWRDTSDDEE